MIWLKTLTDLSEADTANQDTGMNLKPQDRWRNPDYTKANLPKRANNPATQRILPQGGVSMGDCGMIWAMTGSALHPPRIVSLTLIAKFAL